LTTPFIPFLQCGHGRLGQQIITALNKRHAAPALARIDAEQGLLLPTPQVIGTLIICLVPKASPAMIDSPWRAMLRGLVSQVQNTQLSIQRVLHISSTAVFEGCPLGYCDAATPVQATSERVAGLLSAENHVKQLSTNHCSVRLPGLIGPGYERYDPLAMSSQRVRHAVDIRAAGDGIAQLATTEWTGERIEIITDGHWYFQQQRFSLSSEAPTPELLQQFHFYRPTRVAIS
jgi:hypothetical protein